MNHNDEELTQRCWAKKVRALSVVDVVDVGLRHCLSLMTMRQGFQVQHCHLLEETEAQYRYWGGRRDDYMLPGAEIHPCSVSLVAHNI